MTVTITIPTASATISSGRSPSLFLSSLSTARPMAFPNSTLVPMAQLSEDEGSGECKLLGPFSLLVQSALGLLALSSLVWKRYWERPQRPLKIWAFDASKQVVGSMLLHVANLLMSMLSAGQLSVQPQAAEKGRETYQPNPCSFYLLNLAIDTTVGIPILVILLYIVTHGVAVTPLGQPPESIRSGNYGDPPKTSWWAKQCLIYFVSLLGMKACVLVLFNLLPWISRVGDWALAWTEGNAALQVTFVMLIFPLIMNALQYYIIDSYIKNKVPTDGEGGSDFGAEDDDDDGAGDDSRRRQYQSIDESDTMSVASDRPEDALVKGMEGVHEAIRTPRDSDTQESKSRPSPRGGIGGFEEYEPATDGEPKDVPESSTSGGPGSRR